MDHHCPWINNCVGEFNQKYFIQFLFYVSVLCVYTVVSIGISYGLSEKPSHQKVLHTIILLIMALLFGIFVVAAAAGFVYCRARGYDGFTGNIEAVKGPFGIKIGVKIGCY